MSEERIRRELRELLDGFGPPSPGLAARAVAGLPDRRRSAGLPVPRLVASAAALLVLVATALWLVGRLPGSGPLPAGSGAAQLRQRPLLSVPLTAPGCQVDDTRANVRASTGWVTIVSPSRVPLGALMTARSVYKPSQHVTIAIAAGPEVPAGPVLVRGHRLDGPGTLAFAPAPAGGGAASRELLLDAGPRARQWDVSVRASAPGCYAIQLDGATFTETAVLLLYPDTPAPKGGQPVQVMDPAQAAAEIRADTTGVRPVLLPTALVGADWRTEVAADATSFSARYSDPNAPRLVTVAIQVGNLPLPGPATTQTSPNFRGDPRSLYQVADSRDPRSARFLLWREATGASYVVNATGLTDAEFWQLASSLR